MTRRHAVDHAGRHARSGRERQSLGRIVSVTGSKAIVLLDSPKNGQGRAAERPDMGTLMAIDTAKPSCWPSSPP